MDDVAIEAEKVATKEFSVGFRGYSQHDVRAYLAQVAAELAATRERERLQHERLVAAEARAAARPLSDEEIEVALGREAGRVLQAAREAAVEIRSRAEDQVARLVRDASGEGSRAQQEAESLLARRTEEAEKAAAEIIAGAEAQAAEDIDEAKAEGREVVTEAQAVRERVLKDLARRRRVVHQQLEQMRAGRERLLEAYRVVRATLDEATRELTVAEVEVAVETEPEPEVAIEPEPEPELTVESEGEAEPEVAPALAAVAEVEPDPPVAVAEPETEPELNAAVASEEEVHAQPPLSQGGVEGLFARLRAERATSSHGDGADPTGAGGPVGSGPITNGTAPALSAAAAADGSDDEDVLQARDSEVSDVERSLAKALKRALADEQNEVLDILRRGRGGVPLVDLLPSPSDHTARYLAVAGPALQTGARRGVGTDGDSPSIDDLAVGLAATVADDLRSRLQRALEAADGDEGPLVEGISAAYREWKTARAEALARHHVAAAHARGRFAACEGRLRWVVDGEEGPCPDCDDNALAGAIDKGQPFPTGQHHPPAHVGCRCMVVREAG